MSPWSRVIFPVPAPTASTRCAAAVEHRPAQVHQRRVESREPLQQLDRVITRPAPDVQHRPRGRRSRRRGLGDQVQHERRVHRRRLARLQVRKPLDVVVKPLPDLLGGGFLFHRRMPGEKRKKKPRSGCVKSQGTGTLSFGSYIELVLTIWLSVTRSLRMQAVTITLNALPRWRS